MADGTKIEWTDATWNPITGCSVVSPGCTNCYAMKWAGTRMKHHPSRAGLTTATKAGPVWTGEVRFNAQWLDLPLRWRKPRLIFVCAHGDLFHESVADEWIDKIFAVMALAPQHTFQVLTKRADRMRAYLAPFEQRRADALGSLVIKMGYRGPLELLPWPLPNVWLGVSAEDQKRADERIPDLLATPAAIRWVSAEPLLGPIDFETAWNGESALDSESWGDCAWCKKGQPPLHNCQRGRQSSAEFERGRSGLDWIVAGGESGREARPMHPGWVRSIRDQCAATGTPFLFKQWGCWWPQECNPLPEQRFAERLKIAGIKPSIAKPERGCWGADGKWHPGQIAGAPPAYTSWKLGKEAAGRNLDGRSHDAFPEARP